MDRIRPLRMLAIRRALVRVGADQLIQAGLDALLSGVDTPSLRQLAGLSRAEEPEAHDLFDSVIDELELMPTMPDDPTAARWELVRWWCQLIVDGQLAPEVGAALVSYEAWGELGYPESLQPLAGWLSEWEDWNESWDIPRETFMDRILEAIRQLLDEPVWPPPVR